MKTYSIKSGIFDRPRELVIAADYLEWENGNLKGHEFTRLNKSDYLDFKHEMQWIVWYEFPVGRRFLISIKSRAGKELKIRFSSYFGRGELSKAYSEIVRDIWSFYHSDVVNIFLDDYHHKGEVSILGLCLKTEGVKLSRDSDLIPWDNVGTKEYQRYFAVYNAERPDIHSRVSFNEYGAERRGVRCKPSSSNGNRSLEILR